MIVENNPTFFLSFLFVLNVRYLFFRSTRLIIRLDY